MISQHWVRKWPGDSAVRQQAITWANFDPDLRHPMASLLGHNTTMSFFNITAGIRDSQYIADHILVYQDNKVHGANMGPTWVLSAPGGPMLSPWTLLSGMYISVALELTEDTPWF